jgi:hypothetical protein
MDEIESKLYLSEKADEIKIFARTLGLSASEIEGCTTYSNYALSKKDKLTLALTAFKNSKKNTRDDYLKLFRVFKQCTEQGDGLSWMDIDEVLDDVVHNVCRIMCQTGCNGHKDLCIPMIQEAVSRGKKVFILYGAHVKEKLEEIGGYSFSIVKQNGCEVGLWISKSAPVSDEKVVHFPPDGNGGHWVSKTLPLPPLNADEE